MYNWDEKYVSERVALYLYAGILTDTARFLYDTTRQKTFELAAKLISKKFLCLSPLQNFCPQIELVFGFCSDRMKFSAPGEIMNILPGTAEHDCGFCDA